MISPAWNKIPQSLRYLIVGGVNTAIGYGIFAACYLTLQERGPYPLILALAHLLSVTFSFLTHSQWVFNQSTPAPWTQRLMAWVRFQMAYMGLFAQGLVVNTAMLRWVHPSPWLAQLVAMAAGVVAGYFLHRGYVFRVRAQ
jgi:putative flippase GtrA